MVPQSLLLIAVFLADDLPADLKDFDINTLESQHLQSVSPTTDPVTGFVVGGKNPTSLLLSLTELNGRKIADLEADMRPYEGPYAEQRSWAGFLGADEKLLEVMAEDNRYVVEELGLTHQALARPLLVMGFAGGYSYEPQKFTYNGRHFEVRVRAWKGDQFSPFRDKTSTSRDVFVTNLDTGKKMWYSLLVPQMIERYGFYEGKGTRYRVEPRQIVEVFDFLLPEGTPVPDDGPGTSFWWWAGGFALVVVALVLLWRFRNLSAPAPEPSQSPTPPPP
jgi:hypothetical protein